MYNIDRDNFRHLTGLGREWANFVDYIICNWKDAKQDQTGNLQVWRDDRTGEFRAEFLRDEDYRVETMGEYKAVPQLMLSIILPYKPGEYRELISLPLAMVVTGPASDCCTGYQVYEHSFVKYNGPPGVDNERGETLSYIGITKRGWRTRWAEHFRAAASGSHYRFHCAIRECHGISSIVSSHMVVATGLSERAALSVEETLVARDTLYPLGLNMVPGGNAGLAYLRKIGALGQSERCSPDDRQHIINRFFERATRKGLPNPLAAANWLNPNYAEQVICGGPDRLKPQQIRDARFLSSLGRDVDSIAAQVGARNPEQVQRMLSGSTYSRVL